jgi:hypothetical protein
MAANVPDEYEGYPIRNCSGYEGEQYEWTRLMGTSEAL